MTVKHVIDGMHVVPMGMAKAFLVEGDDGLPALRGTGRVLWRHGPSWASVIQPASRI